MTKLVLFALLTVSLGAEDKAKPEPTVASLTAELKTLKAKLLAQEADLKVYQIQVQLEMQVCSAPELMSAKLAARQAHEAADKLPPK